MQGESADIHLTRFVAERVIVSRTRIMKWVLMCGASAFISSAALPAVEPVDDPGAPLLEPLGDNEIANPILDDLAEMAGDVAAFLIRMVPGI
jgi:hypothetical protein